MKIIKPSATIISPFDRDYILPFLEKIARVCYKSEDKITKDSAGPFIRKIAQTKKHESIIEHINVTVHFVVDRGVSHEIVRHRLAAYTQESTRYCNYANNKFNKELTFIEPCFWEDDEYKKGNWKDLLTIAEEGYIHLVENNASPQEARSILPNSLKTELIMTCNLREWKHIFKLRTHETAHPQMREVMIPLFEIFKKELPEIYDDL